MGGTSPSQSVGRFRLDSKLGAGGMGEVYRAIDTRLGRTVALKLLPARFVQEPQRLERFEREARAASALNHPNLVTIYDAGIDNGTPWIAMELVEGRTLRAALRGGALTQQQIQSYANQIVQGLAKAHEAGIVHRDLKPENIMITDGGLVKILDFGLAKLTAPESGSSGSMDETQLVTQAGNIVGTPSYMSPEQVSGKPVDHRSDQFTFGVILYEMITGQNPFERATPAQAMAAVIESNPKPIAQYSSVIAKCLAKNPAERFANTADLIAAMQQPQAKRFRMRWLAVAAIATTALIAGVLLWRRPAAATQSMQVIAVRQFRSLSADSAKEYLSSAVTDEIRSKLSKVGAIKLLTRGATDRYQDVRKLASELGVTKVVEGTVQVEGQKLRISAQVTDPKNEQTLWSEQYDRSLDDVLAVESEIAGRIVTAFQTTLTPEERKRIGKPLTTNPTAYELYLQARKIPRSNRERTGDAVNLLKRAVELDPKFAAAMAEISYRYIFMMSPADSAIGKTWAEKAIAADPDSSAGYLGLADAQASLGMISSARTAFLKAIEVDPNFASAMEDLALVIVDLGQFEESLHWARLALERSPNSPAVYSHATLGVLTLGDAAMIQKWIALWRARFPNFYRIPQTEINYALINQNIPEALAKARATAEKYPKNIEVAATLVDTVTIAKQPDAEQLTKTFYRDSLDGSFSNWLFLPESPRVRYAYFALQRGDPAAARKLLDDAEAAAQKATERGVESPILQYEFAAIHALRNDYDGAMQWLQRAYDRGWRLYYVNRNDPMLASLNKDPRFQILNQRMMQDIDRMKANSTEIHVLFEKTVPSLPPPPPAKKQ